MATSTYSGQHAISSAKSEPIGGIGFDRLMAALALVFTGGAYLDGWAHNHHLVDKTFFTPWHAVLYGGYFLNGLVLVAVLLINHTRGRSWLAALPRGYELSLLGVPLFLAAGVGDLIWHTLFGFEVGIDPLLSPTHLLLALSAVLIISGSFRAAWRRATEEGWGALLPAVLSFAAVLSIFTFFTSFAHPFVQTGLVTSFPYTESDGAWGAAGILLQAGIVMGVVLLAIKRWHLPVGALTLILTLDAALISVFKDHYEMIAAAFVAGIIADLLLWRLQPSAKRPGALRIFAFTTPIIYYLCFFTMVLLVDGPIAWTIHLWLGVTVMSGVVGLLLSYLLVPPEAPAESLR